LVFRPDPQENPLMSKNHDSKRAAKKAPQKTLMEKRQAKVDKKKSSYKSAT